MITHDQWWSLARGNTLVPWTWPATRRVGSGRRRTFVVGEQVLSAWMAQNALVSWVARDRPWELEDRLISELDLPLNLERNSLHQFHQVLTQARARCVAQANELPVLPDLGVGGR